MPRIKRLKQIRIHREGTHTLIGCGVAFLLFNGLVYLWLGAHIVFYAGLIITGAIYMVVINFFRCPIRLFEGDTHNIVVAPADGKVVVVEEVEENEYFHDRRLMISIFMSVTNVHANWFPVEALSRMYATTTEISIKHGSPKPQPKTSARPSSLKRQPDRK